MAFVTPLSRTAFLDKHTPTVCHRRPHAARFSMTAGIVPDVLAKIINRKETEVAALKNQLASNPDHPVAKTLSQKGTFERKKAFYSALNMPPGSLTVLAEIKRRSPSKGFIGKIEDPTELSQAYHDEGAGAISVLTDLEGFGGTLDDLRAVVKYQEKFRGDNPGPCPVIRKDFIIDEVQIAEAAEAGASAILLIVAALGKEKTKELLGAAHALGLDVLVEVHDEEELQIAIDVGAEIIGVNNRNLRTFEVSLDNSFRLAPLFPEGVVKVAESGIEDYRDAWKLRDAGFSAVLVGETLVKAHEQSDGTSYIKAFKAK